MYEYEQQVQNVQQNNNANMTSGIELVGDVAEAALEMATSGVDLADTAGEAVGAVGDVAEAAADGIGDFVGGLFDGVDDLPVLAIVGVVAGAVAVVGGAGYGIYKLVKHFKK